MSITERELKTEWKFKNAQARTMLKLENLEKSITEKCDKIIKEKKDGN